MDLVKKLWGIMLWGSVVLLMIAIYVVNFTSNTEEKPKLGVDFISQGPIPIVSNYHVIVVQVDLGSIFKGLTEASNMIKLLNLSSWEDRHLSELDYDRSKLRMKFLSKHIQLISERANRLANKAFRKNNKRARNKRSLMPGIGKASRWLFGTATSDQIKSIQEEVNKVVTGNNDLIQHYNEQVSILKGVSETVKEMKLVSSDIKNISSAIWDIKQNEMKLEYYLEFAVLLNRYESYLNQIHMGIKSMDSGHLATELVQENLVEDVLDNLRARGVNLISEDYNNIFDFCSVVPMQSDDVNIIRYQILVPLRSHSSTLYLSEIRTVPVWNESLKFALRFKPRHKYLAFDRDLTTFLPLRNLDARITD